LYKACLKLVQSFEQAKAGKMREKSKYFTVQCIFFGLSQNTRQKQIASIKA